MTQELWRDIEGYEGRYQVSNMGRVRSNYGGHSLQWNLLHPHIKPNGSAEVRLYGNERVKPAIVSRLVAMAFVSGYQNGMVVLHKDGNPLNNRWDNLEWGSMSYAKGYRSRPTRVSKTLRDHIKKRTIQQAVEKIPADLADEQWRAIDGYDCIYEVSNMGRIKTHSINRRYSQILNPQYNAAGYASVTLRKDHKGVRRYVHRLVAIAFVHGNKKGMEVNHKDENPRNNRWDNLQWVSHGENINYGTRNRRCAEKRGIAIVQYDDCGKEINRYVCIRAAASAIGNVKSERNIRLCLSGRREHTGGYRWAYEETENKT